jgi:hypothetical protein
VHHHPGIARARARQHQAVAPLVDEQEFRVDGGDGVPQLATQGEICVQCPVQPVGAEAEPIMGTLPVTVFRPAKLYLVLRTTLDMVTIW